MPREAFQRELRQLQDDALFLGSMVEKQIVLAVEALRQRDLDLARQIIANDSEVDRKRYAIEERALVTIATQQPMAGDLRTIAAVIHIVTELERMADHAEGIAKICLMLADEPPLKPLIDIPRMAEKAVAMLHGSLTAFIERDQEAAKRIAREDDEVDALYNQVYRELLTFMLSDPRTISRATYLLWVAHNLERIADRATNICERVVFAVTGRLEDMNISSKY